MAVPFEFEVCSHYAVGCRDVVVVLRGARRGCEAVLAWSGVYADGIGTVHVFCEDTTSRQLAYPAMMLGVPPGGGGVQCAEVAESEAFAFTAAALAPFGNGWTWRYMPWGVRAAALQHAKDIGAVAVLAPRRRGARVRVILPDQSRPWRPIPSGPGRIRPASVEVRKSV